MQPRRLPNHKKRSSFRDLFYENKNENITVLFPEDYSDGEGTGGRMPIGDIENSLFLARAVGNETGGWTAEMVWKADRGLRSPIPFEAAARQPRPVVIQVRL